MPMFEQNGKHCSINNAYNAHINTISTTEPILLPERCGAYKRPERYVIKAVHLSGLMLNEQ